MYLSSFQNIFHLTGEVHSFSHKLHPYADLRANMCSSIKNMEMYNYQQTSGLNCVSLGFLRVDSTYVVPKLSCSTWIFSKRNTRKIKDAETHKIKKMHYGTLQKTNEI